MTRGQLHLGDRIQDISLMEKEPPRVIYIDHRPYELYEVADGMPTYRAKAVTLTGKETKR